MDTHTQFTGDFQTYCVGLCNIPTRNIRLKKEQWHH